VSFPSVDEAAPTTRQAGCRERSGARCRCALELDFGLEADNAIKFARHFESTPVARFPKVYKEASSTQVLTIEFLAGVKIYDAIRERGFQGPVLAKAAVSGLALAVLWSSVLGPGNASLGDVMERSPDRVLDVVNVWARIPVGLLAPAVMAGMTRVTVAMERTRPATGILYAMCVLVYMGELMGKMLQGGTGVPA